MELFHNNVKRAVIKSKSRTVKGWVVTYSDCNWTGAWYNTEAKAWAFAEYIQRQQNAGK